MKLPKKTVFKFYGCGIPKKYALPWLTVYIRQVGEEYKDRRLWLIMEGRTHRHVWWLLYKLLHAIVAFIPAKNKVRVVGQRTGAIRIPVYARLRYRLKGKV